MSEVTFLAPGSDEAIAKGCICPVIDNGHGRGLYTDAKGEKVFVYRPDCPLHNKQCEEATCQK